MFDFHAQKYIPTSTPRKYSDKSAVKKLKPHQNG